MPMLSRILAVLLLCAGLFCLGQQSRSQTMLLLGAGKGAPGSSGPAATNLAFITSFVDTSTQTTYTETSKSFGASPSTFRVIVVAVVARSGSPPTLGTVTIGGVTASCVSGSATGNNAAICAAAVPTGTSGTISVAYNVSMVRAGFSVYQMTSANPIPTGGSDNTSSTIATNTLTIPANGSGLGVGFCVGSAGTTTTWSGLTADFAETEIVAAGANWYNSASSSTPGSTVMKVTYNLACTPNAVGAFAQWGP